MRAALLAAVQFLTVIPGATANRETFVRSAVLFPVVGALLGVLGVAVYQLLAPRVPRELLALLILAMWTLLTGGLHEDGLADTFDAFGGGWSREDILRILKDSRIGVFGALALLFSVLIRWQALVLMPPERVIEALMASQVLPRAGIVTLAFLAGPAAPGTGGAWAAALSVGHVLGAVALGTGILAPVARWRLLPLAAACVLLVLLLGAYFRKKIGGITGDCLGAANQLQEVAILALAVCL